MIERGEADLVDDDQVVAADGFDGAADGVVGDGAPEVFDEVDRGEVANLVAGFDGGPPERDEVVGLAGPGGSDEAQVLGVGQWESRLDALTGLRAGLAERPSAQRNDEP